MKLKRVPGGWPPWRRPSGAKLYDRRCGGSGFSTVKNKGGSCLLAGIPFAVLSAALFGTSGVLAKGLLSAGWSPAAAVTWRIAIAATVLLIPAVRELHGRWYLLRRHWQVIVVFGAIAVAGCQLTFFLAVAQLSVAVALLFQYLGVILIVAWFWVRHGQRPGRVMLLGATVALSGLVLVLGVFDAIEVKPIGVFWGFLSAVGLAAYFIVSADASHALPPLTFVGSGLIVGAVLSVLAGVAGIVDMRWTANDVSLAGVQVPWWVSIGFLGIVATAIAYLSGVAGTRRLGSKVSSFIGLSEVLFAALWAWLLLAEAPAGLQLAGGACVLAGIVMVKLGDGRDTSRRLAARG